MNTKLALMAATVVAGAALATAASAGVVVLSDNFDLDTQMLNWTGDTVFTSVPVLDTDGNVASTDLIGAGGPYDFFPGNGNYVDLDGSTGDGNQPVAGELASNASFGPGTYTVSFDLAGNARGAAAQTTTVSMGGVTIGTYNLASNAPWTLETVTFKTTAAGTLDFIESGPSDQQGNILDNVTLTAVPEPATWAMMLIGVGGIGGALRMGRRKTAASVA